MREDVDVDERRQGRWLWVSKPRYTQDEWDSTLERDELEPGYRSFSKPDDPDRGWWSCDPSTKPGDLALLYRTSPTSEVRWVLRTEGAVMDVRNDPGAQREGFSWGVAYEVLARFDRTVTFREMSLTSPLDRWDAIVRKLHGKSDPDGEKGVWLVPIGPWKALVKRLVSRNPETRDVFLKYERPTPDWL